jgi:Fe2+ or Zn2+ uptake regulation protein
MFESTADPESPLLSPYRRAVHTVLTESAPTGMWLSVSGIRMRVKGVTISPTTALRVLRALEREGLVQHKRAKGLPGRSPTVWRVVQGNP